MLCVFIYQHLSMFVLEKKGDKNMVQGNSIIVMILRFDLSLVNPIHVFGYTCLNHSFLDSMILFV